MGGGTGLHLPFLEAPLPLPSTATSTASTALGVFPLGPLGTYAEVGSGAGGPSSAWGLLMPLEASQLAEPLGAWLAWRCRLRGVGRRCVRVLNAVVCGVCVWVWVGVCVCACVRV